MSLDAVKDWSTNATLNTTLGPSLTLDGTVMKPSDVDNAFREMMAQIAAQFGKVNFKGASIASATPDLSAATGNFVDITGTTAITALGTVAAGQVFFLRFTGVLTFIYNATSLIIPGAANILTAVGDVACMLSLGSGNWLCAAYQRANGGTACLTVTTHQAVIRANGLLGKLQSSGVTISDTNAVAGIVGLTVTGGGSLTGAWTDLGSVTTVDINGGTVDGTVIGSGSPAAGAFTTLSSTGGALNGTLGASTPAAITGTTVTATGQLVISGAGAGQIVFPASQNASANANTFDDYEEGTWTPTITFGSASVGITYGTQTGRYTKLGRATIITGTVILTNKGSSTGAAEINGLPFTADAGAYAFVTKPAASAFTGIIAGMVGEVSASATKITLYGPDSTGSSAVANTQWSNTGGCTFTGAIFS